MGTNMKYQLTLVLLLLAGADALVWSLVLGNPVVDLDDQSADMSDGVHPRNTKRVTSSRPARHHQDKCLEDRSCGKGRFCDLHYGVCRSEKSPGFGCRRDRMCSKGLHCMYGRCQAKIANGEEGSRCHGNSECPAGLCCARRHGQSVCQRKLTKGQRCYVPDGGLEYSLNQLCPCERGLVCQSTSADQDGDGNAALSSAWSNPSPKDEESQFPFWTSTDQMRCQPHGL